MKKRNALKAQTDLSQWTTDQDCYLIEHNMMSLQELVQHLPYSEDEIQTRKKILGLSQRDRQMRKFLSDL